MNIIKMLALFVSRLAALSILVVLFPLVKNIVDLTNTDHFLEDCTSNIFLNKNNNNVFHNYPCLYLHLWLKHNNGNVYNLNIFLKSFLIFTTICSTAYIITSGFGIYGIIKEKRWAIILWISVNIIISAFLVMLLTAEVCVKQAGKFHPSEYFFIVSCSLFYVTFNWIVGIIIILKINIRLKKREESSQFTYFELQNMHEEETS